MVWLKGAILSQTRDFMKVDSSLFQRMASAEKKITIPTLFTLLRIILVPFIVFSMIRQAWGAAFFLFALAALTDVADGFLARLYDDTSILGACLDPIADKLLLLSCFFTLAFIQTPLFMIPGWFFTIILIKEIIILGGTSFLLFSQYGFNVKPTWLGKGSTVVQSAFIAWLFTCYFLNWMPHKIYDFMLAATLLVCIAALVQYVLIGVGYLTTAKECV